MSEQENPQSNPVPENPENAAPEAPEVDLAARVAELEAQVRDVQLRAQAEIQNIQKRAEREAESARKFAVERFAGSLIDVVDNLERALDSTPESEATKSLREGIVLTHKSFLEALKRNAVEQVNPVGEPFNAELHQAVSMQPSTTAEPNSVTAVLAKGYTLSGRLLRPAMVVVATAG
ncbi:MAG: nucleotide exchange factor GrpE [Pedobacter sp.]|nr:nucleotide exchange factor GrpE [Pedobacter sp.]